MKILNHIKNEIDKAEGYKQQFVENGNPNILFVNPVMNHHDFYNMIIPAIALNHLNIANTAFTSICKYTSDSETKQTNLSDIEIKWADVIVFPFNLSRYSFIENQRSYSLFEEIKLLNPQIKIIFIVEVNFWNDYFSGKINKYKGKQKKFTEFINENILYNIKKADKVLVHNENLKKDLIDFLSTKNINKKIDTTLLFNSYSTITEGFEDPNEEQFRDINKVKIYVDLLDPKEIDSFVQKIVSQSSSKCQFYIQTEVKDERIVNLKPSTITHFYKILFSKKFDYYLIYGNSNTYLKSVFYAGKILDFCMFGATAIVNTKSVYDYLSNDTKSMALYFDTKKVVKLFNDENFENRLKLSYESKEISEHYDIEHVQTDPKLKENLIKIYLD